MKILQSLFAIAFLLVVSSTSNAQVTGTVNFDFTGVGYSDEANVYIDGILDELEAEACQRARANAVAQLDALINLIEQNGGTVHTVFIDIDECTETTLLDLYWPSVSIKAKWRLKGYLVVTVDDPGDLLWLNLLGIS